MQLSDVVRIALIFSEDAKRYAKGLAGSIDLSGKADKKKPAVVRLVLLNVISMVEASEREVNKKEEEATK